MSTIAIIIIVIIIADTINSAIRNICTTISKKSKVCDCGKCTIPCSKCGGQMICVEKYICSNECDGKQN